MSHLETYQPRSDTRIYTCAERGQGFQVSDPVLALGLPRLLFG
jgi:hypothetical protein